MGDLAMDGALPVFFFSPDFIANPLPLSPFQLPARTGAHRHAEKEFDYVPGLIADALPDGWGRLLQDRAFARQGRSIDRVTALDRLAVIGHTAMGALVFDPAEAFEHANGLTEEFELAAIAAQAQRILEGSEEDVLPALQLTASSPGGARPKAAIGLKHTDTGTRIIAGISASMIHGGETALPDDYEAWLVKFPAAADRSLFGNDVGVVEACYAEMARRAGLTVPETTLLSDADGLRHFAIARFDRFGPGGRGRVHMHTAGGLLHASFRLPSLDYDQLFELTWALTRSHTQVRELFRRMVFNVYAYNRDDHAKNFSYLMEADGAWAVAPGYDLMYSAGINGHHTTSVAGESLQPTRSGLLQLGMKHMLDRRDVETDLEQIQEAVSAGHALAKNLDASDRTCQLLRTRFEDVARQAR